MTDSQTRADPSPITGWTRETWEAHADRILHGTIAFASPEGAHIMLPGPVSSNGRRSDGFEAFARSFILAAFRIKGAANEQTWLIDKFARGIVVGTDRSGAERWPSLDGTVAAQQKVEAASIALGLALTRSTIWDRWPDATRSAVADWLAGSVGQPYPQNNWVWFQAIVAAFLRSVGRDVAMDDTLSTLIKHESFARSSGWYEDSGPHQYDYYNSWSLHFYPFMWAMIEPEKDLVAEYLPRWRTRLMEFLDDAVALIGADGSPLIQGRSLIYRFATAAPFWMGAITGATKLSPGLLRRAASGIISHFAEKGAPGEDGLLTVGWHGEFPSMRQPYSGAGSPYWAAKGMAGLMLPADHAVWVDKEEPLPVEQSDYVRVIESPGWLVSGTTIDGIVRVTNHGTDRSAETLPPDQSNLYEELGYSTASWPILDVKSDEPSPNDVTVRCDVCGKWTRRLRMAPPILGNQHPAFARSTFHPSCRSCGWSGPALTIESRIRGSSEVRTISGARTTMRATGWSVSAETGGLSFSAGRVGSDKGLVSLITTVDASARHGVSQGSSPIGKRAAFPWIEFPEHEQGRGLLSSHTVTISLEGKHPSNSRATYEFVASTVGRT